MKKLTRARKLKVTKFPYYEYDPRFKNSITYFEDENMDWIKSEYDFKNKLIYSEWANGWWAKWEYDYDNNYCYCHSSDNTWYKQYFNDRGKTIYHEQCSGYVVDRGVEKMKCIVTGELKVIKK